jgi:GAF domain-containing protein
MVQGEDRLARKETARDGFCSDCILQPELMIGPDALEDPRMRSHEYVAGPPHIRFYAGVPLVIQDGFAIGTLCVAGAYA